MSDVACGRDRRDRTFAAHLDKALVGPVANDLTGGVDAEALAFAGTKEPRFTLATGARSGGWYRIPESQVGSGGLQLSTNVPVNPAVCG
jgi:hypothetical protein